MDIFNLEKQYKEYLKMSRITEEEMHPIQRIETRRAFMGGCGQTLILLRDEVSKYKEDQAVEILEDLTDQVKNFWDKEVSNSGQ